MQAVFEAGGLHRPMNGDPRRWGSPMKRTGEEPRGPAGSGVTVGRRRLAAASAQFARVFIGALLDLAGEEPDEEDAHAEHEQNADQTEQSIIRAEQALPS